MEIKDVLKMKLGKEDTLIIQYDAELLSEDDIQTSHDVLKKVFPKNKVLFAPKEMNISIISEKEKWVKIGEGPACFQLIKSGWENGKMYHLIYENPEDGDYHYKHSFVSEKEIRGAFGFAVKKMEELNA